MSLCHGSAGLRLLGGMAFREPHSGDAPRQGCTSMCCASSCITQCMEERRSLGDTAQCPHVMGSATRQCLILQSGACDPCASCPASQSSAGAQSVKAKRFVPRRTRAGFAFATVNPNSSWSMGQLSWEECFQSHEALGLPPGLPMGAGTGEGRRSCKDMWGSLAQPMLLPGPGKQSKRIWMHIFSPREFGPCILTFILSGSIWFNLLQGEVAGAIPATATATPHWALHPCLGLSGPSLCSRGTRGADANSPPDLGGCWESLLQALPSLHNFSNFSAPCQLRECSKPQTLLIRDI